MRTFELSSLNYPSAVFMLFCVASSPASAQSNPSEPLDVQMRMVTHSTFSVGEPIALHYRISSPHQSELVSYHVGQKRDEWYILSVTDEAGHPAQESSASRPQKTSALSAGEPQANTDAIISTGRADVGDVVVNPSLVPTQPGHYILSVQVTLQGQTRPAALASEGENPLDGTPFRLAKNYKFPLVITRFEPTKLRLTAERLSQTAQNMSDAGEARLLLESLFSLPEAQALPAWQALVSSDTTSSRVLSEAADVLGGMKSQASVQILAQLISRQSENPNSNDALVRASACNAVTRLYNASDARFQRQIESVFVRQGIDKSRLTEIVTASHG